MTLIITKLVLKRLMFTTLFVSAILLAGVWLTQSLRFIQVIVNHNVSIADYFTLISFLLPDLLTQVVPICLFITTLFIYHRLDQDRELVALRASGLSNIQLAKPVLMIATGITAFVALMNFYIVPLSYRVFREHEYQLKSELSSVFLQEGAFNTTRGVTVYVKSRDPDGGLNNIFIYYADKSSSKPLSYTIMAQHGKIENTPHGPRLLLHEGVRQELNLQTRQSAQFRFEELSFDLAAMMQEAQPRAVKPYERPIWELLFFDSKDDPVLAGKMRAEAHQRLIQPLFVPLLALLALNTILLPIMQRRPHKRGIFLGVSVAILVYVSILTLINMNKHTPFAIPMAYLLSIAGISLGFLGLKQPWRHQAQ